MARALVRSLIAAWAVAVAATGCADATGPDMFAGTYRLERFEGLELPAVTRQLDSTTVSIVSEHIVLGDDGKGVMLTTLRSIDEATPQETTLASTRAFEFVVRGRRIEIGSGCPPDADCIAAGRLHLVGEHVANGLALARVESSKPASIYRRIR